MSRLIGIPSFIPTKSGKGQSALLSLKRFFPLKSKMAAPVFCAFLRRILQNMSTTMTLPSAMQKQGGFAPFAVWSIYLRHMPDNCAGSRRSDSGKAYVVEVWPRNFYGGGENQSDRRVCRKIVLQIAKCILTYSAFCDNILLTYESWLFCCQF